MSYGSCLFISPSVTLSVRIFLVIHFFGMISIISILFCSLSSSSHSHQPIAEDELKQKAIADGSTTEICLHTGDILCSPEECRRAQMEGRSNKVPLWRYTQACTGQKSCSNLQCFAEKLQIIIKYHTTCGFATHTKIRLLCITTRCV